VIAIAKDVNTVAELLSVLSDFPPTYTVKVNGKVGVTVYREDGTDAPGITIDQPEPFGGYGTDI
jgi:hypothetical protein